MVHWRFKSAGAVVALTLAFGVSPGFAQQAPNGQWFVPGQVHPPAPPSSPRPAPRQTAAAPSPSGIPGPLPMPGDPGADQLGGAPPQLQVQLPPPPEIPPVPKGPATPAAIVGILSVPDVLRISTAYQAAYKELNARGQKLNEDAQKEQAALRDLGQAFATERPKLSPEQIRTKEREITDRATEAQRRFGERNRIIQEAGQYVMAQINRTMEQVAQQVALSRGINLVLNRAQILGTTADFDLTPAVADVMNKALPSVVVPPDGVSPLAMAAPTETGKSETGKSDTGKTDTGKTDTGKTGIASAETAAPAPAKPPTKR